MHRPIGNGVAPHTLTVQLMPLHPKTASSLALFKYSTQTGFTFLVPSYPGFPGKQLVKWVLLLLLSGLVVYNDSVVSSLALL